MAYRLLVVDDERYVVDWLYELCSDELGEGFEIYKAYSGIDALKIIDRVKIDILLSDVKMPVVNGFALMQKMKDTWPGGKVIFLSAYEEFDYVYEANKQSGVKYLVKTEDDDVILQMIKSTASELDSELENELLRKDAADNESLIQYLADRYKLLSALNGTEAGNENTRKILSFDRKQPLILILGKNRQNENEKDYLEYCKNALRFQFLSEEIFSIQFYCKVLDWRKGIYLWFIQPNGEEDAERSFVLLKALEESFMDAWGKARYADFIFVLCEQLVEWEEVEVKAELLLRMAEEQERVAERGIMVYRVTRKDICKIQENDNSFFDKQELKKQRYLLWDFLKQGEKEKFFEVFAQIQKAFGRVQSMHFSEALEIYRELSLDFLRYLNQYQLTAKVRGQIDTGKLGDVGKFQNWKEAMEELEEVAFFLFEVNQKDQVDREARLISQVKEYIRQHLGEDLSLTRIAQHMNYNSSYISREFKRVSEISLSGYILQKRLEYAKKLLLTTDESVKDIAAITGFDTSQYFSIVFKKAVGKTPLEFRKEEN